MRLLLPTQGLWTLGWIIQWGVGIFYLKGIRSMAAILSGTKIMQGLILPKNISLNLAFSELGPTPSYLPIITELCDWVWLSYGWESSRWNLASSLGLGSR